MVASASAESVKRSGLDLGRVTISPTQLVTLGAMAIGVIAAVLSMGFDILTGDPEVVAFISGDSGIGMAGLRYYLAEDWQWPLLHISGLNTPDGVEIALTDSIPSLALPGKVTASLGLPVTAGRLFGLWFLHAFVMQAVAAVWAVRAWGSRSVAAQLAGAAIAVSYPIFLLRVFHPSLMAQWTILAALALVAGNDSVRRIERWGVPLLLFCFLTHPYLFAMCGAVLFAGLLDATPSERLLKVAGRWTAAVGMSVAAVMFLGGYFRASTDGVVGYSRHQASVTGFITPQWSSFVDDDPLLLPSGSFEGFGWVGLGVLVLVVISALSQLATRGSKHPIHGRPAAGRHLHLWLVGIAGLGFALLPNLHLTGNSEPIDLVQFTEDLTGSPNRARLAMGLALILGAAGLVGLSRKVSFGSYARPVLAAAIAAGSVGVLTVLRPSVLQTFGAVFRASGRFVWPLLYMVIVISLARLRGSPRTVAGLAIAVAVLQVLGGGQMRMFATDVSHPRDDHLAVMEALQPSLDDAGFVHMPVNFGCLWTPESVADFQSATIVASLDQTPVDNAYAARFRDGRSNCPTEARLDRLQELTVNRADPVVAVFLETGPPLLEVPPQTCWIRERVTLCSFDWDRIERHPSYQPL